MEEQAPATLVEVVDNPLRTTSNANGTDEAVAFEIEVDSPVGSPARQRDSGSVAPFKAGSAGEGSGNPGSSESSGTGSTQNWGLPSVSESSYGGASGGTVIGTLGEDEEKMEEASRDKKSSFVIIGGATLVALLAGVSTGVIIFLFSVSQLEHAAQEKGETVVKGAVGQVRALQENMEQTVASLGIFVKGSAREHDWSDPNGTRAFLNKTFFYDWNARLQGNSSLYGWAIRALYPTFNYTIPEQNKTEQIQEGCFDICRRPGDPHYTGLQTASVWYDSFVNGSKDYVYALSTDEGANSHHADVWRIRNNPDGSNMHLSDHLYKYNQYAINGNGSFQTGSWQPAFLWTSVDGSTYYYLTYNKMIREEISGTSLTVIAWDVLSNWYKALTTVLQVSERELLMMTQDDGRLLAFSGDELGDLRLQSCTQNKSSTDDASSFCEDLSAATHYHWYPVAAFNQFATQIAAATDDPFSEWADINGSPEETMSYLTIVREVWNKDRLRVVATYSIHRSAALGNLQDQTLITVILASLIILVASCLLAAIGVIALNKTHETVDVAAQLAFKIARYDVDGADAILKEQSTGNQLIDEYFSRIIVNLRAYRPFLPRSLMQKELGSQSNDTMANVADRMEDLEDLEMAYPALSGTDDILEPTGMMTISASSLTVAKDANPQESVSGSTAPAASPLTANVGAKPTVTSGLVALNRLKTQKFKSTKGTIMVVDWDNLPTNDAAITTRLVNVFLGLVINAITSAGGVVDMMQANRIVGTFNYHSPVIKHAEMACKCANRIRAKMAEDTKGKHMNVVIAITTGFNLVGTCGTDEQKSRVVVGESVDLAQKMPTLQRSLGCTVLVTEAVALGSPYLAVAVDYVKPSWHQQQRTKAVTMYELFPDRGDGRNHPLTSIFAKLKQANHAEAIEDLDKLLDDENGEFKENYHANRLRLIIDTDYGNWQVLGMGYGRRELAWEPLEGLDFGGKSTSRQGPSAFTTSISDVKDAHTVRGKLEKAKSDLKKEEVKMVEQQEPEGGGLFSIFVADPGPPSDPTENNSTELAYVSSTAPSSTFNASRDPGGSTNDVVLSDEFVDVAGERWFRTQSSIGAGQFGAVYVAIAASTGLLGAVKAFDIKAAGGDLDVDTLVQEVAVLSEYQNEYIAGYVSCGITEGHFLIIMEYMAAGSMRSMLSEVKRIPTQAAHHYTMDVLRGLVYLHEKGVAHCDIKPDNVLLSGDGTAKLGDFGSTKLGGGKSDGKIRGTARYMAPEAANGDWSINADIFSLGLVMAEMLSGVNPWSKVEEGNDTNFLMRLSRDNTLKPEIPDGLDPLLQSAVEECLQMDPAKRPTAQQLLSKLT